MSSADQATVGFLDYMFEMRLLQLNNIDDIYQGTDVFSIIMKKVISSSIALSLAFSAPLTFSSAAVAAPRAESEQADQIKESLSKKLAEIEKSRGKAFGYFDAKGAATTVAQITSNPLSFSDGFAVGNSAQRILIRGQLLEEGKKGILLYVTYLLNGEPINGQVVTLRPGISKREFQQRLEDLELSFSQSLTKNGAKATESRKTANFDEPGIAGKFAGCAIGICVSVFLGILAGSAGNRPASSAQLKVLSAAAIGFLASTVCMATI